MQQTGGEPCHPACQPLPWGTGWRSTQMRPALPACLITLHELCEPGAVGRMGGRAVEGTVRFPSLTKGQGNKTGRRGDLEFRVFTMWSCHHTSQCLRQQSMEDKDAMPIMNVVYIGGEGMWLPKWSRCTLLPSLQELPLQGIFRKQKCTSA